MHLILNHALVNAIAVAALAPVVWAMTRMPYFRNQPRLQMWLWTLLLVKFVAPPVFNLPVLPNAAESTSASSFAVAADHIAPIDSSQPIVGRLSRHFPNDGPPGVPWATVMVAVSGLGTCVLLFYCVLQVRSTNLALRRSSTSDRRVALAASQAAQALGEPTPPHVTVVRATLPPLLWVGRSGPTVVLPRELVDRLNDQQLQAVVTHELAHYLRRDHWLAGLSWLIAALFWWHPVSWWARRELLAAQEACCDSFVIWRIGQSRRVYADTLLQVLDFLDSHRVALPAVANGFGSNSLTLRRFRMISSPRVQHHISKWHRVFLAIGTAALFCVPGSASDEGLALSACPKAVQKTLRSEAGKDGRVIEVEREKDGDQIIYEAEVAIEGSVFDVTVRQNGRLVAKIFDRSLKDGEEGDDDEDEDEDEDDNQNEKADQSLTMAKLPKAVRKTLRRESRGGEIEELEREVEDGRVIYSADVEFETDAGELLYEIEIAENGVLLRKVLERDDDDDDEDRDDNEDDDDDDDDGEHVLK